MTVTFVHSSDLQLGMRRWFLDSDAQARFDDARKRSLTKLGEVAVAHGAEFIVLSGDIFEHNSLADATLSRAFDAIKALPVPVYLISGNHDPLTSDSLVLKADNLDAVYALTDDTMREIRPGVEIIGAAWKNKHVHYDVLGQTVQSCTPTSAIRIVLGHGQFSSYHSGYDPSIIDLAAVENVVRSGGVDYVAMGDTHSALEVGTTGKIWYSGAPETTDFIELPAGGGEINSGKALVVTIEKTGFSSQVSVTEVPIGEWDFIALTQEINSQQEAEQFISWLEGLAHKDRHVIKYALRGGVQLHTMTYLAAEISRLRPSFAALYERKSHHDLSVNPTAEEIADLGLKGYLNTALTELIEQNLAGNDVATDSINLLYRLHNKVSQENQNPSAVTKGR
ncbi:metallophosphoesterase family protein [Corynebacterium kutscheri]|uniref:Nuclease SbcCD subunit D n=1 Tax=Corynebacterium kutscheri TaxID=35755 RepID=A0AB38VTQ4_9CORY|nr:metallophosphoesterase [Corynebacterium kutscheri]VEH08947.1 Exonuclease, SbcD-family [Corynebacterium kutscheri]